MRSLRGGASAIENHYQERLAATRDREHGHCFVCDPNNAMGFRLDFRAGDDGSVVADFTCEEIFQGYPHWLHGGVISSLLDGAMTNCLFAHGMAAVTGELSIRFYRPVITARRVQVKARLLTSRAPLHLLEAELIQEGRTLAGASGKFFERQADTKAAVAEWSKLSEAS